MTDTYVSPLVALKDEIDNLNDLVKSQQFENDAIQERLKQSNVTLVHRNEIIDNIRQMTEKAETYCIQSVDNGDMEEDVFTGLASIFEWEVTKEIDVTVTAVFKGTITVPRGFETDYLDEQINVECNLGTEIDGYLDCDEISVEVQK